MLSNKEVKEFQKIYKEVFDEEISYSESERIAENFLSLLLTVYKPAKKDE